MEYGSTFPVIILDNGSGYLKAGFSTESQPRVIIPALIGRQMLRYGQQVQTVNEKGELIAQDLKPIMVGDEIIKYRSLYNLSHPITEGLIRSVDDTDMLWKYALNNKLGVEDLSDKKVIITEAPFTPKSNKFAICEILFEKMDVDGMNIEPQAKCSLFCEGIESGVVLDSGDGVSHVIPISSGILLRHSIEKINLAGRNITEYMIRLFQRKGYYFNSSADFEMIRELKEKFCFVSNDIKGDRQLELTTSCFNSYYALPDGSRICISSEKFEAPELLFSPENFGYDFEGVHEILFKSINACPIDTRAGLYGAMVLSGGSTLFPGFVSRLENEIKAMYRAYALKQAVDKTKIKISINVIDSPRRKYSVFLGASIIGNYYNTPESNAYWISREEWLEKGDSALAREMLIIDKCQNTYKEGNKK